MWVGLAEISYDGGPWRPAVAVLEYRGDLVARETIYVTEHFEPPAWRERWRALASTAIHGGRPSEQHP